MSQLIDKDGKAVNQDTEEKQSSNFFCLIFLQKTFNALSLLHTTSLMLTDELGGVNKLLKLNIRIILFY